MSALNGCYLSYPIDQQTQDNLYPLRVVATAEALLRCSWVFDPGRAFTVEGDPRGSGLRNINMVALAEADLLVAFLPKGVPSIGVVAEVEASVSLGKQVVLISDCPSWMWSGIPAVRVHQFEEGPIRRAIRGN